MDIDTAAWILGAVFACGGILALLAAMLNWDWFFNSPNVRAFTFRMPRTACRVLYGAVGLGILAMAWSVLPF